MLFNSIEFLAFLAATVVIFFALPPGRRWFLLLVASYAFYGAWRIEYLGLLFFSTLVDFLAGTRIADSSDPKKKKNWLGFSIATNLAVLGLFKYFYLATDTLQYIGFQPPSLPFELVLPVGISFYTFQSMSYSIDVYRGQTPPERSLPRYALFLSFFPQLVAGPIERSSHLLPQLRSHHRFEFHRLAGGLSLLLMGALKKVVVADGVAPVVDTVYQDVGAQSGAIILLATVLFAVQIYCDFSGYSDMAIGTARIFGIDLMRNFERPYFSSSLGEFWKRWHISLSTWFRDYLYVPLGGNRRGLKRHIVNLLIVFLISGLWHGAAWTFVIWGAIHGVALSVERLSPKVRLPLLVRILVTNGVVLLAWAFFRASSFDEAVFAIKRMLSPELPRISDLWALGLPRFEFAVAITSVVVLFLVEALQEYRPSLVAALWENRRWRIPLLVLGLYALVFFGRFGTVEFIYFQF